MPRAKLANADERVRKLGDRIEEITAELSDDEVEQERSRVIDLLGRRDNLEAARKSLASEYKAKIEAVDTLIKAGALAATSRKKRIEVTIEEWLTQARAVVRLRADTEEVIGRRNARSDELQETLFEGRPTELEFPSADDAFGK